jgi:hypothetical protein
VCGYGVCSQIHDTTGVASGIVHGLAVSGPCDWPECATRRYVASHFPLDRY